MPSVTALNSDYDYENGFNQTPNVPDFEPLDVGEYEMEDDTSQLVEATKKSISLNNRNR